MKIFNILIIILIIIIIYKIIQNYNSSKIEKFNSDSCSASLTHWKKETIEPNGVLLDNNKWTELKEKIKSQSSDELVFKYKIAGIAEIAGELYLPLGLDYKISMNDYIKIEKNGGTEYWSPSKKWKDGVVSYFCTELCVLRLGYEWIKINESKITNLQNIADKITTFQKDSLISLIKTNTNGLYAKLTNAEFNNLNILLDNINVNSYIIIELDDNTKSYYKVAANIEKGRRWQEIGTFYNSNKYNQIVVEKDNSWGTLSSIDGKNIIILNDTEYETLKTDNYYIERTPILRNEMYYTLDEFDYDICYEKSCAQFANNEFDNYLNMINLRESLGYKTSTLDYTTELMHQSDEKLLNLVDKLQLAMNNAQREGKCSSNQIYKKIVEIFKTGEYVLNDNGYIDSCPKTYDMNSYVNISNICDDLDNVEYRTKINPEIYKHISSKGVGWLNENNVLSKNHLAGLLVKYLDDIEYFKYNEFRNPETGGNCIIIENPITNELMDSKNTPLDNSDIIELYTGFEIHTWIKLDNNNIYQNVENLDNAIIQNELVAGKRTFTTNIDLENTEQFELDTYMRNLDNEKIYKFIKNDKTYYFNYMGLSPLYIKYGKIGNGKYTEITEENKDRVNVQFNDSIHIDRSDCIIDTNSNKSEFDKITQETDDYYDELLGDKRNSINDLTTELTEMNTATIQKYNDLCNKYETDDYKLYTNYDIVKFTKNNSLDTANANNINLNNLAQKTVKLKVINSQYIKNKFNESGEIIDETIDCKENECRYFGNIGQSDEEYDLLNNYIKTDSSDNSIIIININDFSKIVKKINILKNDYILYGTTTTYKISNIYNSDISSDINNDVINEKVNGEYPDIFTYSYKNFMSKSIDLHKIDITKNYYIVLSDNNKYELNIDKTFKNFLINYNTKYNSINDLTTELTENEKCVNANIFAASDAISKSNNPCMTNFMCKTNDFNKEYTLDEFNKLKNININDKETWNYNDKISLYDEKYNFAVGNNVTNLDNTYANYWINKYNNEIECPPENAGKETQNAQGLYNVNPNYYNGLKWYKMSEVPTNKRIIEIYPVDYSTVLFTSLDIDEELIDFTADQNNIRFIIDGSIVGLSSINETDCLKITYDNGNINYYETYGTNVCSDSRICSDISNIDYSNNYNNHIKNIYNDDKNCEKINDLYSHHYDVTNPIPITTFESNKGFKVKDIHTSDIDNYPMEYDNNFELYNFNI